MLKIIITGHVDHGKSTLIGRLVFDTHSFTKDRLKEIKKISKELGKETEFAFLLDSLEEERKQERTIDTAQTFFKTKKRRYVIIDAPGHVEFLKNMITGATQAEAAVLIVDAAEGLKEQTKRHAYILSMLGLKQMIAVINKMDLVSYSRERFEEVKDNLLKFLDSIGLKPLNVIPISAKKGNNISRKSSYMNWYKEPILLKALDSITIRSKKTDRPLRFPIQDIYQLEGRNILAGRVESGAVRAGQKVFLLPSNHQTEIESIVVFNQTRKTAETGECIGLTLKEASIAKRGEVICEEKNRPAVTDTLKADIFWMADEPLRINESLNLRYATQDVGCSVCEIEKRVDSSSLEVLEENASQLRTNEVGIVLVKTDKPIVAEKFGFISELGRFILEKDNEVCSGGIVTALM